jgi:hypothetical protein
MGQIHSVRSFKILNDVTSCKPLDTIEQNVNREIVIFRYI